MPPNAEGIKQVVGNLRTAFPDLKFTIEDLVGEGDKVCARLTASGTHKGVFEVDPIVWTKKRRI
jgi:predicted ester cyclase